jgi:hypothetical protein
MSPGGTGVLERYLGQLLGYADTHGGLVVSISILVQTIIVAIAIRVFFRDDQYRLMGFVKAFGYALMFVVGAPVAGLISSALLVWLVPMAMHFLDVLTFLKTVSSVDEVAAAISRPWAYAASILVGLAFFVWRIRGSKQSHAFTWCHAGQVAVVLMVSNIFFQLVLYSVVRLWG